MNIVYIAILILAAFVAIWLFVVVPAEKRHHERKLEIIRKKIADREGDSHNSGASTVSRSPENQE